MIFVSGRIYVSSRRREGFLRRVGLRERARSASRRRPRTQDARRQSCAPNCTVATALVGARVGSLPRRPRPGATGTDQELGAAHR